MSVVNYETGEIVGVTELEVRASVRRVIDHAESIWDEWAWQVENRTWAVLGYASWDEMRRGEYGALTSVTAPRAERPELVARFRGAGLTQRETADTLGVHVNTVKNHDEPTYTPREPKAQNCTSEPDDIVDAEIVEDDEAPSPAPKKPIVERHRTDVVRVINLAIVKAEQTSAEAAQIKRSHLRGREEEAAVWSRRLRTALADVEELLRNLEEISS